MLGRGTSSSNSELLIPRRGPEVEFWLGARDGADPATDNDWNLLPFMALSDGAHTCVQLFCLPSPPQLTGRQSYGRFLLFYTATQSHGNANCNIFVWHFVYQANLLQQAEEQVSRCYEVDGPKGCGGRDSRTTAVRTFTREAVGRDYRMVCTRVGPISLTMKEVVILTGCQGFHGHRYPEGSDRFVKHPNYCC